MLIISCKFWLKFVMPQNSKTSERHNRPSVLLMITYDCLELIEKFSLVLWKERIL